MHSLREDVLAYAAEVYGTAPEYLWRRFPRYAVLRRGDGRKWYGLLMDVPRERLGLDGTGRADILDIKIDDPFLRGDLLRRPGFLPGYHLSRRTWTAVLLDGTVPLSEVCALLDASWRAAAGGKQAAFRPRPPKEWLVPANPAYFDIDAAFAADDVLTWKQSCSVRPGDTVFLYVGAPVSAVRYQCRVVETDLPCEYDDGRLTIRKAMKLRRLRTYDPSECPRSVLKDFGVFAVRGPRGVPTRLSTYLHQGDAEKNR